MNLKSLDPYKTLSYKYHTWIIYLSSEFFCFCSDWHGIEKPSNVSGIYMVCLSYMCWPDHSNDENVLSHITPKLLLTCFKWPCTYWTFRGSFSCVTSRGLLRPKRRTKLKYSFLLYQMHFPTWSYIPSLQTWYRIPLLCQHKLSHRWKFSS